MGECDTFLHPCTPLLHSFAAQTLPLHRPRSPLLPCLCQMPFDPAKDSASPVLLPAKSPSLLRGAHKHTQGRVLLSGQLQLSRQGPLAN